MFTCHAPRAPEQDRSFRHVSACSDQFDRFWIVLVSCFIDLDCTLYTVAEEKINIATGSALEQQILSD